MNCFQFDYFCGYHTAAGVIWRSRTWLWIAFNLITFVDITQLSDKGLTTTCCCELLSIWLLLWISHSCDCARKGAGWVVNCFQFDYFCGYHTAVSNTLGLSSSLWIAFNLITFVDITQQKYLKYYIQNCCELLSIWLLLWISHSNGVPSLNNLSVVNCFQFDYFCGYHTAIYINSIVIILLWIAFNLITFVDITQLGINRCILPRSCELLSIWLLLWISHSAFALR